MILAAGSGCKKKLQTGNPGRGVAFLRRASVSLAPLLGKRDACPTKALTPFADPGRVPFVLENRNAFPSVPNRPGPLQWERRWLSSRNSCEFRDESQRECPRLPASPTTLGENPTMLPVWHRNQMSRRLFLQV